MAYGSYSLGNVVTKADCKIQNDKSEYKVCAPNVCDMLQHSETRKTTLLSVLCSITDTNSQDDIRKAFCM